MDWILPGTTLTAKRADTPYIEEQFRAMFFAGGMVLSQVASVTGLEPYVIQNWIKRGFLSPPVQKRYTMNQLCRILNINMLKSVLPLEQICGLLTYVNGDLEDDSDDLIDDAVLYFLFVRLAADFAIMQNAQGRDQHLEKLIATYHEPVPGGAERVKQVLRIMLTAWAAAQLRQTAEEMIRQLKTQ